ncbi:MAG: hypothetical protein ACO1N1_13680 [Dyadobacter fermentans]
MKIYLYALLLASYSLAACDKQPPFGPRMVNEIVTGEVNGLPFKSEMTVEMGANIIQDLCDKDVIWLNLLWKTPKGKYQSLFLHHLHCMPGNHALTDSSKLHNSNGICTKDSVQASLQFKSDLVDDHGTDYYRLVEGPESYLRIIAYNLEKREIRGEFSARFVRIKNTRKAAEAEDTLTYTNGKFIFGNIHVQEIITEPR